MPCYILSILPAPFVATSCALSNGMAPDTFNISPTILRLIEAAAAMKLIYLLMQAVNNYIIHIFYEAVNKLIVMI